MLMGAPACNMPAPEEKVLNHRIVDDGLQYHSHEARLSHVVESSRESSSTGQESRFRCTGLIPLGARIQLIQLPLLARWYSRLDV